MIFRSQRSVVVACLPRIEIETLAATLQFTLFTIAAEDELQRR